MRNKALISSAAIGLALLGGGVAYAATDDATPAPTAVAKQHEAKGQKGMSSLAEKLGVTEDQLRDAMKSAHGTNGDREQALADALGIDVATVTTAMGEMYADHQAAMRSNLETRIDDAVAEGTLTESDKESVLKAFDAGLLAPQDLKNKGLGKHAEAKDSTAGRQHG